MLNRFRHRVARRVIQSGKQRQRRHGRFAFERLEDRAMLSASSGKVPHGNGNSGGGSNGRGGPQANEKPAFTSQPQNPPGHAYGNIRNQSSLDPAAGRFKNQPAKHESFGPQVPDPRLSSSGQHVPSGLTARNVVSHPEPINYPVDDSLAGLPPGLRPFEPTPSQPTYSPSYTSWQQFAATPTPAIHTLTQQVTTYYPKLDEAVTTTRQVRTRTLAPEINVVETFYATPVMILKSPSPTYPSFFIIQPIIPNVASVAPLPQIRLPNVLPVDLPVAGIPPASNVLGVASTLVDLPVVPQFIVRDATSAAALSTVARDVALRDYAPRLPLMNAASPYDRATLMSSATEALSWEALDGFIATYDETFASDLSNPAGALSREREAVNAVLQELEGVALPVAPSSIEAISPIDGANNEVMSDILTELWNIENLADGILAGEVDRGMVLLQSTGDANESNIDLTQVYADQVERFEAPVAMETSIGLYQAVDVALEEGPLSDPAQPASSTTQAPRELKLDVPLPEQREQSASPKAAALVGASTLVGALLGAGHGINRHHQPQSASPDRRRAHRAL